jgi:hypothetical protein
VCRRGYLNGTRLPCNTELKMSAFLNDKGLGYYLNDGGVQWLRVFDAFAYGRKEDVEALLQRPEIKGRLKTTVKRYGLPDSNRRVRVSLAPRPAAAAAWRGARGAQPRAGPKSCATDTRPCQCVMPGSRLQAVPWLPQPADSGLLLRIRPPVRRAGSDFGDSVKTRTIFEVTF